MTHATHPHGTLGASAVTLDAIRGAAARLEGVSRRTPLLESLWLGDAAGGPVYLKCENLQRTGSFKIRGAYNRIVRLPPEVRARGVVAASAGNHAQGVALAARMLGVPATVFMPDGAPIVKEHATRHYGADVRFHGRTVDEALVAATAFAEQTQGAFIHPFDHPDIVIGQATAGLEILEQCPEVRSIVVPAGGGGLLAGIATAVRLQRPDVEIIGVQAAGAAAFPASLAAGHPVRLAQMQTLADGIAVGLPGKVPFELIRRHVDGVTTVTEEMNAQALMWLAERQKLVAEPAGSVGVAAVLGGLRVRTPAVIVLSGGNIDPLLMGKVLRHGLAAAGRYLSLRVRVPDRPGALVSLLQQLADLQANVLEVVHERTRAGLALTDVDIAVVAETRGADHQERILTALRRSGIEVVERRGRSD